jgi:hypothetical protein
MSRRIKALSGYSFGTRGQGLSIGAHLRMAELKNWKSHETALHIAMLTSSGNCPAFVGRLEIETKTPAN